jgi:protein gp37
VSANSNIAWCHHTFNCWWGCDKVSEACKFCYAESFAKRTGHDAWGPKADRRFFGDKHWAEPLAWNAAAEKAGERHRVFCSSMADVFEDRRDLDEHRARLWKLIEATPHLDWLLLTKRPECMARLAPAAWAQAWPTNVWAGTTIENQRRAEERILWLLSIPASVLFISAEPLLEVVNLRRIEVVKPEPPNGPGVYVDALTGHVAGPDEIMPRKVSWVIGGLESGPGRRPCEVAWLQSLADQCAAAGAAYFVKQDTGMYPGKQGRIPEALWARKEFPAVSR